MTAFRPLHSDHSLGHDEKNAKARGVCRLKTVYEAAKQQFMQAPRTRIFDELGTMFESAQCCRSLNALASVIMGVNTRTRPHVLTCNMPSLLPRNCLSILRDHMQYRSTRASQPQADTDRRHSTSRRLRVVFRRHIHVGSPPSASGP